MTAPHGHSDSDPELPLDPEEGATHPPPRRHLPVRLSPANPVLVAAGVAVGTGCRYVISTVVPPWAG